MDCPQSLGLLVSEGGANIHAKDASGQTALFVAAAQGNPDCMLELLEKGARLQDKDNEGKTALTRAAETDHWRCVNYALLFERVVLTRQVRSALSSGSSVDHSCLNDVVESVISFAFTPSDPDVSADAASRLWSLSRLEYEQGRRSRWYAL